jgi:mono/diheme cytochrome c family protein
MPQPTRSVWEGVYTTAQAKRGSLHTERCSACHGFDMQGDFAPPLMGSDFSRKWDGKSLGELFQLIEINFKAFNENERAADPDTLSRQQAADFLAYLLLENQFPGGVTELPAGLDLLKGIRYEVSKK